eukprot:CAMPEP_0185171728 /NCGR_PEP_ID=MMETSP1139-20130426/20537_1 /TAXON_ID=298111 /ORGANISM="Pavlova sp., Strain CCMP459" /LENGTH=52 /DNA_ID=CAMNT_0027737347 /DNA_START=121 /DNA_END=276 /DNA_ORIENTATION=-
MCPPHLAARGVRRLAEPGAQNPASGAAHGTSARLSAAAASRTTLQHSLVEVV